MKGLSWFLAASLMVIIAGCGGGGGNKLMALHSEPTLDGYATSAGGFETLGDEEVFIGDRIDNATSRMFLSFDISAIPAGATIDSAMLRVYQSAYNHNGYSLGPVSVDHITFGTTVSGAIYSMPYLAIIRGNLSTSYSEGSHQIEVTSAVQDDVTGSRPRSQYRIYHDTPGDSDGVADDDGWLVGDSATNPPELVVTSH